MIVDVPGLIAALKSIGAASVGFGYGGERGNMPAHDLNVDGPVTRKAVAKLLDERMGAHDVSTIWLSVNGDRARHIWDDIAELRKAPTPAGKRRRLPGEALVSLGGVKVTHAECAQIKASAQAAGLTIGAWVRSRLL